MSGLSKKDDRARFSIELGSKDRSSSVRLDFLMLLVSIGPVLALLPPSPSAQIMPRLCSDYAQGPYMALNPDILTIWAF